MFFCRLATLSWTGRANQPTPKPLPGGEPRRNIQHPTSNSQYSAALGVRCWMLDVSPRLPSWEGFGGRLVGPPSPAQRNQTAEEYRTSNVQLPTSNKTQYSAALGVRCWMLDVSPRLPSREGFGGRLVGPPSPAQRSQTAEEH